MKLVDACFVFEQNVVGSANIVEPCSRVPVLVSVRPDTLADIARVRHKH